MALGFDDYGTLTLARSADVEEALVFPSNFNFDGFTGELQIRDTDSSPTIRLSVTPIATANGSNIVFNGNVILLAIKKADTATLPDGDPYEGCYEWVVTDPLGLTSRLVIGTLVAERGVVQ